MDESMGNSHLTSSENSPLLDSTTNVDHSHNASTSITNLPVPWEQLQGDNEARHPHFLDRRVSAYIDEPLSPTVTDQMPQFITDDTFSCVAFAFTFSLFVSVTMILGVYGSANLLLGSNSSILMQPNPLFVKHIKVEGLEEAPNHPEFYGFHETPALDDVAWWTETYKLVLDSSAREYWVHFLNPGSQINVSYTILSPASSVLVLVLAQGNEGLSKWLDDPASSDSILSRKILKGHGMIQLDIFTSASYFLSTGNLNAEAVEVELNLSVRALLYNTSGAYYECSLIRGNCNLDISFDGGNLALLTTPGSPGLDKNQWHVKLSYEPRWITYLLGIGGMTVVIAVTFYVLNNSQCTISNRVQVGRMESERTPFLLDKDGNLSSWGSLCDSVSHDDEDLEYNDTQHLCAICFDAPRGCFFFPCGHCVACFACGKRIAEAGGTCPICRRQLKMVKKILIV